MSKSITRRATIAIGLLAIALVATPVITPAQNVTVIVNGQTMSFDQPPIIRAGRVFVPLRGIFEQLGASVVYANGQINATAPGRNISLNIGSTAATVNGQSVTIDVAPFIVGVRTLVPLRFIAQSLGATVDWNDSNSTVTIVSGRPPRGEQPPPQPAPRPIVLTYQWPTGTVYNHYPQIRFQLNRPFRVADIAVLLDGNDITSSVQNNGQYFYAVTPFSLQVGSHRVRIHGRTVAGMEFDFGWTFQQGTP